MDVLDISVIGSGIASTLTLIEVLQSLLGNAPSAHKTTIAVIEKHHEMWKGIPYGPRSSVNALTITSIHDFINEREAPLFFKWLKDTQSEWVADYKQRGGITAAQWLKNNLHYIDNSDWETVYVPRFLYGNYLKQKVTALQKEAGEKQVADVMLIHAEAIDVQVVDGLHKITLEYADGKLSTITSHKLVIAAGSPPVKTMCNITSDNVVYVNEFYEPSAVENIKILQAALSNTSNPADRNILVIGSNASSIELVYLLEGMPEMRKLINKTIIISSSGILPHATATTDTEHLTPNLDEVKANGEYNIQTLSDAALQDILLAVKDGANMEYVATIIKATLGMMEILGEQARKEFFALHAIRLRNNFRRAGPDYRNVADLMLAAQEVELLKGRFLDAMPSGSGALVKYQDSATGKELTHTLNFKAIINCSGSDDLDCSSSRLLSNLVNNNICKMNLSRKGIEVNQKFEAAPNLYVMGPLLGGNVNKLIHFWQLENASRLTYLAPYLAKELVG